MLKQLQNVEMILLQKKLVIGQQLINLNAKIIDKSSEKEANKLISDYNKRVPTKSIWRDNIANPDSKTYKIDCWYSETVKVQF